MRVGATASSITGFYRFARVRLGGACTEPKNRLSEGTTKVS